MSSEPDLLLRELLEAAGYDLTRHRDESWVAIHRDSGRRATGKDPRKVALAALRALRQQVSDVQRPLVAPPSLSTDISEAQAELALLQAQRNEARAELTRLRAELRRLFRWIKLLTDREDDQGNGV